MIDADPPAEKSPRLRAGPIPDSGIVTSIYIRVLAFAAIVALVIFAELSATVRAVMLTIVSLDLALALVWRRLWLGNPRFPIVFVCAIEGVLVATVFVYLEPQWSIVALFSYVMVVVYLGELAGRTPAVVFGIATVALAAVREITLSDDDKLGAVAIVMFAMTNAVVIAYTTAHSFGPTRTTESLERLHEALRTVTSQPELVPTLESVTAAARTAIRGEQVVIQLREGDHLVLAAGGYNNPRFSDEAIKRFTRWELASGDKSPLARTVNLGETVVVTNLDDDPRFPDWIKGFRGREAFDNAQALVTVPLGTQDEVVGAMSAFFRDADLADAETVRLLQTYAEHVTLLIVRTQAYDRERQLTARLREADRLKSDFVALASHQLRTPLTATKGFIDTVLYQWDRLDDATRRDMLERAAASADDLGQLLTQLLDLSRVEGADVKLDIRPLDLVGAVNEVVTALPPLPRREIVVDVPEDLTAYADHDALRHVLDNLIANAVKFSPPDSRVTVAGSRDHDEVILEVVDEGPGIPLDEQERIFERFYRASPSRGAGGTGLGLAIAQSYVNALGGRIWVESEPGQGSAFVVALPSVDSNGSEPASEEVEGAVL